MRLPTVPCGVPSPPINGSIEEFTTTEVVYRCDPRFSPPTEVTATCKSGNWSPTPPADLMCTQTTTGIHHSYTFHCTSSGKKRNPNLKDQLATVISLLFIQISWNVIDPLPSILYCHVCTAITADCETITDTNTDTQQ